LGTKTFKLSREGLIEFIKNEEKKNYILVLTHLLLGTAFVGQPYHGHAWGSCTGYRTTNRPPNAPITSWSKVWIVLLSHLAIQ
jgi:hypothetical protein